jgi:hypothetical protein
VLFYNHGSTSDVRANNTSRRYDSLRVNDTKGTWVFSKDYNGIHTQGLTFQRPTNSSARTDESNDRTAGHLSHIWSSKTAPVGYESRLFGHYEHRIYQEGFQRKKSNMFTLETKPHTSVIMVYLYCGLLQLERRAHTRRRLC